MMIVPTYVGPSEIEGVGIFAAAPIARGTAIWTLSDDYDLLLSEEQVARMDALQRDFVDRYGYPHTTKPGLVVVEFDNGRFMNHSDKPNGDFSSPAIGVALRDIAAHEELTCDYAQLDPIYTMQPGRSFIAATRGNGEVPAGLSPE
ncbi:SET domain-containing protein [Alteraurantiacibacter aquimixticola]|uniref:SET domain-containing protein-lysine N-methyltransferase n=1 Tax=Alteraurantiacibacter aquimixticola TaxID=2489173 RepID=A0A4T3EYP8_9SPHN|nr:SET domain-containing protein [Alteraurantiacibacter aquimixticola]TIX49211.1 SET domain-containing protein-lysine N-methyltransferase [Alteraurantiacibacter aquimixticola]